MAKVAAKRVTANIDGDFVVFLIGMRINKPWKPHKWLPVFRAMPRMIRELETHPESGFLGHIMNLGVIVQYWRSFEHLEAYADMLGCSSDADIAAFSELSQKSFSEVYGSGNHKDAVVAIDRLIQSHPTLKTDCKRAG